MLLFSVGLWLTYQWFPAQALVPWVIVNNDTFVVAAGEYPVLRGDGDRVPPVEDLALAGVASRRRRRSSPWPAPPAC